MGPSSERAWDELSALLRDAAAGGQTTDWFAKRLLPIVETYGWSDWIDPENKFAFKRRAQGVHRCVWTESTAAKQYAQIRARGYRFWIYRSEDSARFCPPEHHALHGLCLPSGHPFWQRWAPPNTFGCVCKLRGADTHDFARRMAGDPDKPLPDWWNDPGRGPDPAYWGDRRPDLREIVAAALADRMPW